MGTFESSWELHRRIAGTVPDQPDRIGYAALQDALDVGQRGRVKRAVSTLVGLGVLQWAGMRNGRAVTQGPADLDELLAEGLTPMPEREIQTYPLLTAPLDAFLARWHEGRGDRIDGAQGPGQDGVTVYNTSAMRPGRSDEGGAHTRPDLTGIVDLHFEHLGEWNEVHAVEVKPYWAVDRAALFEAAAQAALGRCTFSWLLAWVPDPESGHFTAPQQSLIREATRVLPSLQREAADLGLGLLVAKDLAESAVLEDRVAAQRRAMDPRRADELFKALDRTDGN
jgi:hypothetical protein